MFSFKLRPSKKSNKSRKMRTKKHKGGSFLNKAAVPLTLLGLQSYFNKNAKKVGLTRKFKRGVSAVKEVVPFRSTKRKSRRRSRSRRSRRSRSNKRN
jgi:hypothetical protein